MCLSCLLSAYLGLPPEVTSLVDVYMTKGEGAPDAARQARCLAHTRIAGRNLHTPQEVQELNLRLFNRIVNQVMIVPVLALVLVAAALTWQVRTSSHTVGRIQDSDDTISQSNYVGRLIIDQETGVRGYAATGDPRFLEPYSKAVPGCARRVRQPSRPILSIKKKNKRLPPCGPTTTPGSSPSRGRLWR